MTLDDYKRKIRELLDAAALESLDDEMDELSASIQEWWDEWESNREEDDFEDEDEYADPPDGST